LYALLCVHEHTRCATINCNRWRFKDMWRSPLHFRGLYAVTRFILILRLVKRSLTILCAVKSLASLYIFSTHTRAWFIIYYSSNICDTFDFFVSFLQRSNQNAI
jgi:hypothetical protein